MSVAVEFDHIAERRARRERRKKLEEISRLELMQDFEAIAENAAAYWKSWTKES